MEHKLYNLKKLDTISSGNRLFKQAMIELFISVSSSSLKEIKSAFEDKNHDKVKQLAHRLKPSITSMGITSIEMDILKLEQGSLSKTEMQQTINKVEKTIEQVNKQLEKISLNK